YDNKVDAYPTWLGDRQHFEVISLDKEVNKEEQPRNFYMFSGEAQMNLIPHFRNTLSHGSSFHVGSSIHHYGLPNMRPMFGTEKIVRFWNTILIYMLFFTQIGQFFMPVEEWGDGPQKLH
ncbi:hypothetical protein ACJX0J_029106, partial [Zea mays]